MYFKQPIKLNQFKQKWFRNNLRMQQRVWSVDLASVLLRCNRPPLRCSGETSPIYGGSTSFLKGSVANILVQIPLHIFTGLVHPSMDQCCFRCKKGDQHNTRQVARILCLLVCIYKAGAQLRLEQIPKKVKCGWLLSCLELCRKHMLPIWIPCSHFAKGSCIVNAVLCRARNLPPVADILADHI